MCEQLRLPCYRVFGRRILPAYFTQIPTLVQSVAVQTATKQHERRLYISCITSTISFFFCFLGGFLSIVSWIIFWSKWKQIKCFQKLKKKIFLNPEKNFSHKYFDKLNVFCRILFGKSLIKCVTKKLFSQIF